MILTPVPVLAQLSSAAVNGTVKDNTGAAVPKAVVVLQNTATSVERSTLTNDGGNYAFPSVAPGRYTVRVSAPSFQTEQISAFDVGVDQVVALNSTLRAGDVKVAVEVEAEGVQIESATSQLGTVMEQKKVQDLPLNGRNFTQLLTLTPGATPVSVGQNSSGGNTAVTAGSTFSFPSINGQPNRSNLYLVDGMNDNNAWYNTYAVAPVVDSIQEFKVNSHNDAQYGQVTGGVVNVATKSGTNAYHGAVWEYIRNNAFDARPRFAALSAYHLNQFGGVLGGPLSIPKLYDGRNKTFIFLSYEGTRYSRATVSSSCSPQLRNWARVPGADRRIFPSQTSAPGPPESPVAPIRPRPAPPPASSTIQRWPTAPPIGPPSSAIKFRHPRSIRVLSRSFTRSSLPRSMFPASRQRSTTESSPRQPGRPAITTALASTSTYAIKTSSSSATAASG
jgi:hypothetical protein